MPVEILVTATFAVETRVVANRVAAVIPPDNLKLVPVALVKTILVEVTFVELRLLVDIVEVAKRLLAVISPVSTIDVPDALVKIISDVVIFVKIALAVEISVATIVGTLIELVTERLDADIAVILTLVAVIFVVDRELVLMLVDITLGVVIPVEMTTELPLTLVASKFSIVALLVLIDPVLILDVTRILEEVILPER